MGAAGTPAEEGPLPSRGPAWASLSALLCTFYLAGPLLMLSELLRPGLAALLLLAVAVAAGALVLDVPALQPRRRSWLAGGLVIALTLGWIVASGIGGVAFCRSDYTKHLVMFDALLRHHLPVVVTDPRDGAPQLLHYYFAYYIAPVRVAQVAQALWSALDLDVVIVAYYAVVAWAALQLLARLAAVPPLALLVLLILTGGFDPIGMVVFGVEPEHQVRLLERIPALYNLEWWGVTAAPQAFTSHLFWAPQHFFGAFIGLPLLLAALRGPARPLSALLRAGLVLAAALLWSPYVAVGLALVGAAELWLSRRQGPRAASLAGTWRPVFGDARLALALTALGLPAALYVVASQSAAAPRLLLAEVPIGDWFLTFVLNHGPFIAAAAAALWLARARGGASELWRPVARVLFCGLLLEALLLSLIHGRYNDWGLRTTLPVLLWMALPLCRLLVAEIAIWVKALLFLAVGLSSASSVMETAQSLAEDLGCPADGALGFEALAEIADQYLADGGSLFYRWLARAP